MDVFLERVLRTIYLLNYLYMVNEMCLPEYLTVATLILLFVVPIMFTPYGTRVATNLPGLCTVIRIFQDFLTDVVFQHPAE
jgi:hypothetical protein